MKIKLLRLREKIVSLPRQHIFRLILGGVVLLITAGLGVWVGGRFFPAGRSGPADSTPSGPEQAPLNVSNPGTSDQNPVPGLDNTPTPVGLPETRQTATSEINSPEIPANFICLLSPRPGQDLADLFGPFEINYDPGENYFACQIPLLFSGEYEVCTGQISIPKVQGGEGNSAHFIHAGQLIIIPPHETVSEQSCLENRGKWVFLLPGDGTFQAQTVTPDAPPTLKPTRTPTFTPTQTDTPRPTSTASLTPVATTAPPATNTPRATQVLPTPSPQPTRTQPPPNFTDTPAPP